MAGTRKLVVRGGRGGGGVSVASSESHGLPVLAPKKSSAVISLVDFVSLISSFHFLLGRQSSF